MSDGRHPSSQAFVDSLMDLVHLHDRKQADYGTSEDPFANVRSSEAFGLPAWVGCMIRANDKMKRIQKASTQALSGEAVHMENESVEDSFDDLAVYAQIGKILFKEWAKEQA